MNVKTIAQQTLKDYWDRTIPVNLHAIADRLGVRVIESDEMGEYSGRFEFDGGTPVCMVNAKEAKVRRRFTLAHELGHYILSHGPAWRDTAKSFSTAVNEPIEREANQFAAELLMPAIAVSHLITNEKIYNISEIAKRLEVSEVAVKWRLKNLGWIS